MRENHHIGTSGWSYYHWTGIFYPEGLEKKAWLSYYARWFNTVEINSTFYRLPFKNVVKGWKNKVPENFTFAVKGSKTVTHNKRLKNAKEDVDKFIDRISLLESNLGVVLWQLPPSLKKDKALLEDFLKVLPKNMRHSIEFRHKSWFDDEIYSVLEDHDIAFCIVDSKKLKSPWIKTASFVYVRFHGPEKLYASEYSEEYLKNIAEKLLEMNVESFIYFNNDFEGYAIKNARFLKEILCGGE